MHWWRGKIENKSKEDYSHYRSSGHEVIVREAGETVHTQLLLLYTKLSVLSAPSSVGGGQGTGCRE